MNTHQPPAPAASPRLLRARGLASGLLALALGLALAAFPATALAQTAVGTPLVTNPDFELDSPIEPGWPADWGTPKAGSSSWELEEGRRYIRINTTTPGETVLIYRIVNIPADVKALEMSLRARVIGLKCGPQPWFDARIMADFKNPTGHKIKGAKPITFRKDTDGWVERKVRFLVPDGGVALEIMPTLFQAYSGTFDIDQLQLTVIDPAEVNGPAKPPIP